MMSTYTDALSAFFSAKFHAGLAYSSKLCQRIYCVFSTSHLVLLEVRSFLSTQMLHKVRPLHNNPTLDILLSDVGILLPKIPCCQSRGF